jgi:hypothetical protein
MYVNKESPIHIAPSVSTRSRLISGGITPLSYSNQAGLRKIETNKPMIVNISQIVYEKLKEDD